ncbi:hypothetical protein I4U23_031349 [Adineta vaga]|nr:hypothetical protein I4U23_031349 [Adineta vaga]
MSVSCGQNTGFYFTLRSGSMILAAFSIGIISWTTARDSLTVTIEGSNFNGSTLTLGSSWVLIYNGSSGLLPDPGRLNYGTVQILTGPLTRFASYRFIVTSKRGFQSSTGYSEVRLIFY